MSERYTVRPWTDVVKEPELPGDVAETAIVGWDVVRDVQEFRPGVVSYDLIEQFDADQEAQARDLARRLNAAGPQPLPGHGPNCTGPDWGVCSCERRVATAGVESPTPTQVFFYEQDFYVLSNFSAFNLAWSGWSFDTSEHAYHWEKFNRRVDGNVRASAIERISAPSAHEAFKIAERNKALRRPIGTR
jgi:hypothetical protein